MSEPLPIRTVEIPFTYRVHYKARTWTNERWVMFAASVAVPFRAVEAEAAPVAMRLSCTSKGSYGRNPFRPKAEGAPREVRWFEDGFWIESGSLDKLAETLEGKAKNDVTPFAEVVDVMAFHAGPTVYAKDRYNRPKPPETPSGVQTAESLHAFEHGIRYITDDGGAAVAETIAAAGERCIVIDGTVFESIPEPCLGLSSYGDGMYVYFNPDANRSIRSMNSIGPESRFGLHEMEAAVAALDTTRREMRPLPHVEILRGDLVFDVPQSRPCLREADSLGRKLSSVGSRLPRNWIGPAAALVNALSGKPRHPTPAVASALESLAALSVPAGEELNDFLRLARRRDSTADEVIRAMTEGFVAATGLAPMARRVADAIEREGGLSASVVSLAPIEDSLSKGRLRQARSREDVRRAARLMGEGVFELEARMARDPDIDLVLYEVGDPSPTPGDDMRLRAVAEIDLSSGEVVTLSGDGMPQDCLRDHLDKAWPGTRPETSYATPGIR